MPIKSKTAKPKRMKKFKAFKSLKAKFYTAIRKANKKRPPSSLELLVYAWLEEDGIPFKKERAIGRCHVDIFLEPNICVEIQGCHWHKCQECYPSVLKKDAAVRLKDAKRFSFFKSKGMQVVEIWEHEILNSPAKVRKLLRSLGPK